MPKTHQEKTTATDGGAEVDTPEENKKTNESERDAYAEFKAAVSNVTRVRYRVKREDNPYMTALFVIMGIITVCAVFIGVGEVGTATVVLAATAIAAVVVGIVIFIISKTKANTPYYCYYARTDDGVFCMSVVGDNATVFWGGTAYRVEGENCYTLDGKSYREWLDGEGAGLYSALETDEPDFEYEGGVYAIAAPHGGAHEFVIKDGVIETIKSVQPYATEEVDPKTGEAKIKYRHYVKSEPTTDFTWEIPEFIKDAFAAADIPLPDMSEL